MQTDDIGSITIHICHPEIHISDPKNYRFDTNSGRFFLFLHVKPFPPLHVGMLRMHLNGIRNVTIHLYISRNYGFHINISLLSNFFTYHPLSTSNRTESVNIYLSNPKNYATVIFNYFYLSPLHTPIPTVFC